MEEHPNEDLRAFASGRKRSFFLEDWSKLFENGTDGLLMNIVPTTASLQGQNLISQEIAEEIKAVASAALKLNKIELKEIEDFERNERIGPKLYTGAIKSALEACFSDSIKLQVLVEGC